MRVRQIGMPPESGDAAAARAAWLAEAGQRAHAIEGRSADLIVDAIFGIGLSRAPADQALAAIEQINAGRAAGSHVLALDVPSGLDADSGTAPGAVVTADLTVSFIARKRGLYTGQGPELCGDLLLDELELPSMLADGIEAAASLTDVEDLAHWLPRRGRGTHKGDNGHVLLIGGDHGTPGAILLAARAALRAGAGLVSIATREAHAAMLVAAQPELMVRGVEFAEALQPLIEKADAVAIGPGLGQRDWGRAMFHAVADRALPLVVDADALNLLAVAPRRRDDWVLTPHPGEAARLLGQSTSQVQADRFGAAAALRRTYGGAIVLKGAGSLIQGERLRICPYGNPGMGTGGMGDALTGIVAALLAQGLALDDAMAAAVTVHARAGDLAAIDGERGLLPSDLINALRAVVNP